MKNQRRIEIITPQGKILGDQMENLTEREEARRQEDKDYIPVILKRTDEAKVHPDDILERAIDEGVEQLNRPTISLFLSSIAAGLILGFSAMAVAVVSQAIDPTTSPLLERLAVALVYPLGFVICIMSGTQLFTEHTATAVYPILDGREHPLALLRLWIVVITGNLVGTLASSALINMASDVVAAQTGYLEIANHLVHFDFFTLLVSGVLAGWLMAQGAWMLLATPPQSSQIICIYLVTFLIGVGGLHHSIAGSAEIFTAVLISPDFRWGDALYFVSTALLGNLIGGSTFVAILNYAHIRQTQKSHINKASILTKDSKHTNSV